jgi:hypothetical protein
MAENSKRIACIYKTAAEDENLPLPFFCVQKEKNKRSNKNIDQNE